MKKRIIIGECNTKISNKLESLGFEIILYSGNESFDIATRTHADLSVLKISENQFVVEHSQKTLIENLSSFGCEVIETKSEIKGKYPNDILLNFAIVGDFIIGNQPYADESLKQVIQRENLKPIHVNQGYAKCSTLILTDNAIITEDEGINNAASEYGIDTLLIKKGEVALHNHQYGFIGGASCMLGKNEALFFGDITKHTDFEKIKEFLSKYNVSYDYIQDLKLTDIGGSIII